MASVPGAAEIARALSRGERAPGRAVRGTVSSARWLRQKAGGRRAHPSSGASRHLLPEGEALGAVSVGQMRLPYGTGEVGAPICRRRQAAEDEADQSTGLESTRPGSTRLAWRLVRRGINNVYERPTSVWLTGFRRAADAARPLDGGPCRRRPRVNRRGLPGRRCPDAPHHLESQAGGSADRALPLPARILAPAA